METDIYQDELLRREAGDGWHPDGIDEQLLGAIVLRERLVDAIVNAGGIHHASDSLIELWKNKSIEVSMLKKRKGIGEPKSLLDEDS